MKPTILKTAAGALALLMTLGVSTSALAAPPDQSAELPADIGATTAGIQVSETPLTDHIVEGGNFATAPDNPRASLYEVELINSYWTFISPIEVEIIITPTDSSIPQTLSIGNTNDTRTVAEAGLTETFVAIDGETINAQLSGLPVAAVGETMNFNYSFELPAASNFYTNADGFLAAYGYEYETKIWFEGISPTGERFVFAYSTATKMMTPVFYNIRTGEDESCDPAAIANGQACVGIASYGIGSNTAQLPYPPLAQDGPVSQTIPTSGVCEITSISEANGQITVEAQFDIYAPDRGTDAPYGFPSIDLSNPDVSPVYVFSANLEDNTATSSSWTEAELFTEPVDWITAPQEIRQGDFPVPAFPESPNLTEARFFEGIVIPFTFNSDSTTPVEDRELTLAFEVVFPQSGEGALPLTTCSTGIATPVNLEEPQEPLLPITGGDNTFLLVAVIFGALVITAGTTFIIRARRQVV